jgi:hypothetical protein
MPPEIAIALVQAATLLIGAVAAYIAQQVAARQKAIGRSVSHSNVQNDKLCVMIKANTALCEGIEARLKSLEVTNAENRES